MEKLPIREPLSYEAILCENLYANLTDEQLETIWEQMRFFYANGYTQEGTLLDSIREQYVSRIPTGVVLMEQDFLRAVTCRHFKN